MEITAKVDSSEWPEDQTVITPVLHVNVNEKLTLEADVQLSTWIAPEESMPLVKILKYCHKEKVWEVIRELPLSSSKSIQFKCATFSKIVGILAGFLSIPCRFQPSIFAFKENLIFCVHLEDSVISESVYKYIKAKLSTSFEVSHVTFNPLNCKCGDQVAGEIVCLRPEGYFTVSPTDHFFEIIDIPLLMGKYSSKRYALWGGDDHKKALIQVKIGKEKNLEAQAFVHDLLPGFYCP